MKLGMEYCVCLMDFGIGFQNSTSIIVSTSSLELVFLLNLNNCKFLGNSEERETDKEGNH